MGLAGPAAFQAAGGATEDLLVPPRDRFEEPAPDRPAGQADGAPDDEDVPFLARDISVLESDIGVAFVGGHETGRHLDALRSELQEPVNVVSREDPARGDDGQVAAPARLEFGQRLDHFGDQPLELKNGVVDLLGLEAEMSSRAGAFDDDAVGDVVVGLFPRLEDEAGRPRLADARHDLDAGPPDGLDRDALYRQARSEEEDVDLLLDGRVEELMKAVDGDHDVDAPRRGAHESS